MNSTQSWTDDNVAKLVKQKQKEELENILKKINEQNESIEKRFPTTRELIHNVVWAKEIEKLIKIRLKELE